MMHLIHEMHAQHGIPVLVLEPAKHEYRVMTTLPDMKDHSPLPGAQWDPKMIEMVRRSNELSVQAIDAMKSK